MSSVPNVHSRQSVEIEDSTNSRKRSAARMGVQRLSNRVQFLGDREDLAQQAIPPLPLPQRQDIGDASLASPDWQLRTSHAAQSAQDRAFELQSRLSISVPVSPTSRPSMSDAQDYFSASKPRDQAQPYQSPPLKPLVDYPIKIDDMSLVTSGIRRPYDLDDEATDYGPRAEDGTAANPILPEKVHDLEARRLVRSLTKGMPSIRPTSYSRSGTTTPAVDRQLRDTFHEVEYVPAPDQYKPGILSSILFSKLQNYQQSQSQAQPQSKAQRKGSDSSSCSDAPSQGGLKKPPKSHGSGPYSPEDGAGSHSGRATPSGRKPKWYDKSMTHSNSSSITLSQPDFSGWRTPIKTSSRPGSVRSKSTGMISHAVGLIKSPRSYRKTPRPQILRDHIIQLELQVSDILARRRYLLKLCKALMMFGAPTHRMEEYMNMSARKMLVQGSFQYLPNCMIVAFDDSDTHTTEVHLVKEVTAIDLGKFKDVFDVYKNVIHEKYSAIEATDELIRIMQQPKRYPVWLLVLVYGVAAVSVGPFAFNARPLDFPICFLLGCTLGWLQLVVVPSSAQFSHVFEVAASVVISFAARGFGSIMYQGQPLFCFSAIAQSSIALILPGWIILCAAQELQSRNLIAGSIRMVYAIIYTLFLGFGIMIGTTLMGLVYSGATDTVTCDIPWWWNGRAPLWRTTYVNFAWVPVFTICLAMVNQARWGQMLPMTIISLAGYTTNYFASMRFAQNIQIANACGAFVIGAMANLYSRFFHGLAAATMLPAIFVQVPSGLAAGGSLVAGVTSANQITRNATGITVVNNGTQGFLDAQSGAFSAITSAAANTAATAAAATVSSAASSVYGGTIFNVGYGMVQVAIGISVGLFLSALFVYPFNKRRSGLFSF